MYFRGLTTKKENTCEFNETWVEGDLIHSGDKVYIHPVNNRVSVKGEMGNLIIMHEVQPDTVTQINDCSFTLKLELENLNNLKEQRSKYTTISSSDITSMARKSIIDDNIIHSQSLIINKLLNRVDKIRV